MLWESLLVLEANFECFLKPWAALQAWRLAGDWKATGVPEQVAIHVLLRSSSMKCQQVAGLQTRVKIHQGINQSL